MITVYVIRSCSNGKRYVGITNNLSRRLVEHRCAKSAAGHLLGDFELLHTEEFPDYSLARRREQKLKSGQGREWLDKKFGRVA
jgi:predicted GIY-YIG superfamily endonuclease